MRYLIAALAVLALAGCADYDDSGYAYNSYPAYSEGYGYTAPYSYGGFYAQWGPAAPADCTNDFGSCQAW